MVMGPPKYIGKYVPSDMSYLHPKDRRSRLRKWFDQRSFFRARRDSYAYGKGYVRKRWWGWQYIPTSEVLIFTHEPVKGKTDAENTKK